MRTSLALLLMSAFAANAHADASANHHGADAGLNRCVGTVWSLSAFGEPNGKSELDLDTVDISGGPDEVVYFELLKQEPIAMQSMLQVLTAAYVSNRQVRITFDIVPGQNPVINTVDLPAARFGGGIPLCSAEVVKRAAKAPARP